MITFISEKTQKLSRAVSNLDIGVSYFSLRSVLRRGDVKVNGKRVKDDVSLVSGDKVDIYYTPKKEPSYLKVFVDENIVIVNKKSGFTSEKVFEDLKAEFKGVKFIHRLDRNTSGLLVFALTSESETALLEGFKNRDFEKYYTAEVIGKMPKKEDVLTAFLVKNAESSTVKVFNEKRMGAVAIKTGYKVIEEKENTSILRVTLYTGKTHQIRAHLSFIGHAIVGDGKYGDNAFNKSVGAKYQRLSASEIVFHFKKDSVLYYLDKKGFKAE